MNTDALSIDRIFQETCVSIRATDEISFKLMGFVPLVSGATFLVFFLKEQISSANAPVVFCFALYAALITLGLFRWELRNIQTCSWLRRRAEALEQTVVTTTGAPKQPLPPLRIGKTEAEKWIYSITILAWLSIPPLVCPPDNFNLLLVAYVTAATLVVAVTALSVLGTVRVPKMEAVTGAP
jgi:hypothetical protein